MFKLDIEEALKTASATILILVFAASFHQNAPQAPRPTPDKSMRLIIFPARPIHVAIRRNTTILDFDSNYNIIQNRHTTIELALNEKSSALLRVSKPADLIWGRDLAIRLQNGRADLLLVARRQECAVDLGGETIS